MECCVEGRVQVCKQDTMDHVHTIVLLLLLLYIIILIIIIFINVLITDGEKRI